MSEVRRCICPGSYDPVTLGHVDVVRRSSLLFDEVVVGVLDNASKAGLFSLDERVQMLEGELADASNVRIVTFGARLLVDVCAELSVQTIVKGLRGESDYAYELPMAVMNRRLSGVETLFLPGEPGLTQVSSSLIKEVVRFGGDVSDFVSPRVLAALGDRIASSGSAQA